MTAHVDYWDALDRPVATCPDDNCDGESHWDGQRDRDGESAELGPCPRWGDRGDSAVVVLYALASCALVFLLLLAIGQRVMCDAYDNALRYCPAATETEETP